MAKKIRVAILDDHQSILDGYSLRLSKEADIEVVLSMLYGEELEPSLAHTRADVLILDAHVPVSRQNPNPFPLRFMIPRLLQFYPDMSILVISMHAQRTLIHAVMECGARGYILKDDNDSILNLAEVIREVYADGIYLSDHAFELLMIRDTAKLSEPLSARQVEALSLCAAYPDCSTAELSLKMNIAPSTMRNLLSNTYLKLKVRTRSAAVAQAVRMGLIPSRLLTPKL